MSSGTLKIHSENILPIIKKWLYSDRDIFLRELVSNGCDAISKLKILRDQGDYTFSDEELKVQISIDKENRLIRITDTGIGMTEEEVEKYISQLAFSGAEEFVKKYEKSGEAIIGHFGLGFYSAFMVSSKVTIDTLSYQEGANAVFWSCDGSSEYELSSSEKKERGTTITLHIDQENEEFLEESRLREILNRHCRFLPYPIFLNDKQINEKEPLWIHPASQCEEKDYLEFYRYLYPTDPDPIFWIHLNVDYPFHLKGILYFPKITKQFDFQKSNAELYCNRVFVSDNCKDLMPDFLTVLKGVIDSPDIPLNVSRSYLQMDRTVRQLATHISKKVSDKLKSLYQTNKEEYLKIWPDIEMIIKLGILQDQKFYDRIKECLIFKNLEGNWTTIEEYLERNKEKNKDKVFYHMLDEKHQNHLLDLYKDQGIEVLIANTYLDTPLINFLEMKLSPTTFCRIDGSIDEQLLDASKEKNLLDASGKSEAANIADSFRSLLDLEKLEVEAKSLSSAHVPAIIVIDEQTRRMRDYLSLSSQELPQDLMNKQKLVLNTNNSLINAIYQLKGTHQDLAKGMAKQLYELALLSQKELSPKDLSSFIKNSTEVLEKLATFTTKKQA